MMTKEKLECYRHLEDFATSGAADDIIDSHLEALKEIERLTKNIKRIEGFYRLYRGGF